MNCPCCTQPLEYTDTIDRDVYDSSCIEHEIYYCKTCDKTFSRIVYYELVYKGDKWEEA